jgi:hypothetical protein
MPEKSDKYQATIFQRCGVPDKIAAREKSGMNAAPIALVSLRLHVMRLFPKG